MKVIVIKNIQIWLEMFFFYRSLIKTLYMKLIEDGFFDRNKKVIIIAFVIFIVFALLGMIVSNIMIGDKAGIISETMFNLSKNSTSQNFEVNMYSFDLFVHNLIVSIVIIVGGLFFSIISVIVTIFNALSIGAPFGADLTYAAVSILPHSIFEYSATALSLAVAFLLTRLEIKMIKNRSFKGVLSESKTELKDILILIIVVVVLLIVAAFIII